MRHVPHRFLFPLLFPVMLPSFPSADGLNDLQRLIASVPMNGTVTVPAGVYYGRLRIVRAVTIYADSGAHLIFEGSGSAIEILCDNVTIKGLTIRGSGRDIRGIDAAIILSGTNNTIDGCFIENALFGIHLKNAWNSTIRGNKVHGIATYAPEKRGDAIRITSGGGNILSSNTAESVCDGVYFDHTTNNCAINNEISFGRYGIHLMFSTCIKLTENRLHDNTIGAMIMKSKNVELVNNVLKDNRTINGVGVCAFETAECRIYHNAILANTAGIELKKAFRIAIHDNMVAHNSIGVKLFGGVEETHIYSNRMMGNVCQIGGIGGRNMDTWSYQGRGNYWDDYRGYDLNRDGIGDAPYRINKLFSALIDKSSILGIFFGSPLFQFLELAGNRDQIYDKYPLIITNISREER